MQHPIYIPYITVSIKAEKIAKQHEDSDSDSTDDESRSTVGRSPLTDRSNGNDKTHTIRRASVRSSVNRSNRGDSSVFANDPMAESHVAIFKNVSPVDTPVSSKTFTKAAKIKTMQSPKSMKSPFRKSQFLKESSKKSSPVVSALATDCLETSAVSQFAPPIMSTPNSRTKSRKSIQDTSPNQSNKSIPTPDMSPASSNDSISTEVDATPIVVEASAQSEIENKRLKKRRTSIRFNSKETIKEIPHREDIENHTPSSDEAVPIEPSETGFAEQSQANSSVKNKTSHSTDANETAEKTLKRRGERKFTPSETLLNRARERNQRNKAKETENKPRLIQEARENAIIPEDVTGLRRSKRVRYQPGKKRFFKRMLMEKDIENGVVVNQEAFMTEADLGVFNTPPNAGKKLRSALHKASVRGRKPGTSGRKQTKLNDTLGTFGHIPDFDDYVLDRGIYSKLIIT